MLRGLWDLSFPTMAWTWVIAVKAQSWPLDHQGMPQNGFFFFQATLWGIWDLSSLTKDQTCAPCIGNVESYPLDHFGSPMDF